jgi:hypothetical protein
MLHESSIGMGASGSIGISHPTKMQIVAQELKGRFSNGMEKV